MIGSRDRFLPLAPVLLLFGACSTPERIEPEPLPEPVVDTGLDLHDVQLGLVLDPVKRIVEGDCQLSWLVTSGPKSRVELTFGGPKPYEVTGAGGRDLPFQFEGDRLTIELTEPWSVDAVASLRIRYRGPAPRGLWFEGSAPAALIAATRLVADAEPVARSGWLPSAGVPASERATLTLTLGMPKEWTAIAPGVRESREVRGPAAVERWRTEGEQPLERMAFAAGEFSAASFESGGTTFELLTQGNDPRLLEPSLRESGPMLEYFEELFRAPYPYERFSEVCLPLERSIVLPRAALLPDTLLGDELARRDDDGYLTLAGAIARQWLGGSLQPLPGHGWLDEGLAAYVALLYGAETREEDEFLLELRRAQSIALEHAQPLVGFDVAAEGREALLARSISRLELLRHQVGDDVFRAGLADYVEKNQGRRVQTSDLQASMELASRSDLGAFFEDWILSPGDPSLDLRWVWHERSSEVVLDVVQTHGSNDGIPAFFRSRVEVEMRAGSNITRETIELDQRRSSYRFKLSEAPVWVRFDRVGALTKRVRFERGASEWLSIAAQDLDPLGRAEAVAGLGQLVRSNRDDSRVDLFRSQVSDRALNDPSAAVRASSARELGRIGGLEALLRLRQVASEDPSSDVRRSALQALVRFAPDEELATFAAEQFDAGFSWRTRAEAARLYTACAPAAARRWLTERLVIASPQERLRADMLRLLAELPDAEVTPLLLEWARDRFASSLVRVAAIEGLSKRLPQSEQLSVELASLLTAYERTVRMAAIEALAERRDPSARRSLAAYAPDASSSEERRVLEAVWRREG